MTAYTLRDIEPGLWKRVKAKAAFDGRSVKWILLSLLTYYASKGMPK